MQTIHPSVGHCLIKSSSPKNTFSIPGKHTPKDTARLQKASLCLFSLLKGHFPSKETVQGLAKAPASQFNYLMCNEDKPQVVLKH